MLVPVSRMHFWREEAFEFLVRAVGAENFFFAGALCSS
jgi:hypothetical protein